ncbi:MAG: hypothetical protein ACLPPF_15760 [Rhodomicrobium sp.]
MFLSRLKDPEYCIAQAEVARMHASLRRDKATKASLLKIADVYTRIAKSRKILGEAVHLVHAQE